MVVLFKINDQNGADALIQKIWMEKFEGYKLSGVYNFISSEESNHF